MAKYTKRAFKRRPARAARRYVNRRMKRKPFSRVKVSRWKAPLGNFPSTKTVALRYVDNFSLNPSSSTAAVHVFRANSLYDPDLTSTGHQPMFFDNYGALYSKYRVNYANISFIPLQTHAVNFGFAETNLGTNIGENLIYTANERACRIFILRSEQSNDYQGELNTLIEEGNRDVVWRYCPQNTSQRMPTLRMKVYPHSLMNLDRKDGDLASSITGNPTRECYFVCGAANVGDGSNPDEMSFQVIITYNVTFFDLIKNQPQN